MSECAGVTGEEVEFLLILRKIEEMWRQGFVGSMTVHCSPTGRVQLEYTATWKSGDERRSADRRGAPRDGEDRRQQQ